MSDRQRLENAKRKGKKAYWSGIPLYGCPLRARDSILAWERAWSEERALNGGMLVISDEWRRSKKI